MTENNTIFLIDTNILIYAFDESEPLKHKIASQLLLSYIDTGNSFAVSTQNLGEFFNIITTRIKKTIEKEKAIAIIQELIKLKNNSILEIKPTTIIFGCHVSRDYNLHFWDSLLAATMKENGIFNIYTENTKDFKIPWIKAVNPFSSKFKYKDEKAK